MMLTMIAVAVLSQAEPAPAAAAAPPAAAPAATPAPAETNEEKTLKAFERLSAATEKLAAAAERLSPPPPPTEAAKPPAGDHWDLFANAGLTWSSGNVSSVSFVGAAGGIRKAKKTIITFKLFGGYGQATNAPVAPATEGDTQVLLYNAGVTGQFDYRFNDMISAFVGAGVDTDHVKSVELRGYGDLGVGVLWLNVKAEKYQKVLLKTDLNLRVQPEERFQYYPTEQALPSAFLLGPRVAVNFRYAMSEGTFFAEDLEVIPNVIGDSAGRVLFNSNSKLAVSVAANVSVSASLSFKYDSQPAEGKKDLDTLVTFGLDAAF